ncbi:MAG: Nif3-like dinuclear metal center hexameric protein [Evtepia gabavorous]
MGRLEGGPMTVAHFARRAKETLGLSGIRVLDAGVPVQRVAVGGGACGSMLPQVRAMGCDTFLTADPKHDLLPGRPGRREEPAGCRTTTPPRRWSAR